jgi:hypothetical protein
MPVVKTIIKNTNNETVVKVAGTAAAATIDLSTDLVASTQATDGATQTVNIAAVQWVGLPSATVTIARNATTILTLPGGGAETLDFANGNGYVDNISNTDDITVTIAGAEAQCYLVLRKAGGYATKVETVVFGAYDNETAVGS